MNNQKAIMIEKENEKLRERLEELSDFIENGSVPLHRVNGDGIIIWANQAELDLLGYSKDEYVGLPISQFHNDADVIHEILHRLTHNEILNDFPAKLKCKNGGIKYVTISSNALFKDGTFVHSRCFTKDVTPLIKEEERKNKLLLLLEESEERLRLAIQATQLGTWDWDFEEGKILFSDQSMKIMNLTLDRFNNESILNLIHIDDLANVNQTFRNLMESKSDSHFDFECRILKSDQSIAWLKVQGSTYFTHAKSLRRIIGTMVDITEFKKTETKNAELVAIINSSNDAIVGKTLNGVITSWNYAAEELFGYTADEIIGKSVLQLIPEDRKNEEDYIIERIKAKESIKHFETKRLTKDNKLIDVSLTISPIKNDEGEILGVSKIARNITEKKQEERRKNDFVSIVSHELRTPLTSILLYSQVLQTKYKMKPEEIAYQISAKIETQTQKMVSMVHDFLSLARIEEGKLHIRKEVFDIKELFEEARTEAELISSNHSIKISCSETMKIFADRDKMGQVFTNLLSNAIKYSPSGGTINIGCKEKEGRILVYVSDEGIGISKNDQKNLFDRFFRAESQELGTISGFGIGLYIVAEILRSHNTEIEVKSQKGIGTIFRFYLDQHL
ncbi:PAS domain S-box protein [Chryseobacterium wangxinyae]|uniref:PAS domain-containing sensor histidine kinase n=1 Tax=Chryseobacterium sp. CY350 TaxID=2997336 RepID=UPI00226F5794|nr:PAS domain S-box protein [Chryseobacterium sp. CY350]MCY0976893.1 PAS domain S-box protein [Chryseobacterium sp. CY350]WBZ96892.1 PAS domain S-box protein [Chryseobacterium sp. CY350]